MTQTEIKKKQKILDKLIKSDILSESQMERHDLYNFEAKLDYTINDSIKNNEYSLNTYFFIPRALEINRENYSQNKFYSDMSNYIRFKTPKMALSGLINPKNKLSPCYTIKNGIIQLENGNNNIELIKKIDRELKLLGCICKTTMRDQFEHFYEQYERINDYTDFFFIVKDYINEISLLRNKMMELEYDFSKAQIPLELRESFSYVRDWVSVLIERQLTTALESFRETSPYELKDQIKSIIVEEHEYRTKINSRLILREDNNNEKYTYWESILKKYVQQVLYLDVKSKDQRKSATEVLHSIAAGIAMFFSLFLGLLFASNFEANSIPYIAVFTVIYMLKDRIKENIRVFSNKAVGILLPDRRREIYDYLEESFPRRIGVLKESMHFMRWEEVPEEIIRIREATNKSPIERKGKPENVFRYKKKVKLFTDKINEIHTRHGDISDIIRFNVLNFLQYADDPIKYELLFDKNSDSIQSIATSKVYHINVIFELSALDENGLEKTYYKKVRVVLDQKGIKRVSEPAF